MTIYLRRFRLSGNRYGATGLAQKGFFMNNKSSAFAASTIIFFHWHLVCQPIHQNAQTVKCKHIDLCFVNILIGTISYISVVKFFLWKPRDALSLSLMYR